MKKIVIFVIILLVAVITVFNIAQIDEVYANSIDNKVTAKSYIVIDSNGKILKEKKSNEKREVASICKLMTTLITLEKINDGTLDLNSRFLTSDYAASAEGSQAFLDAGQEYKICDLLKSVIVASANDSAIVLAEGIAGSESNFVRLMNDRAFELKMYNTRYANSTGLPAVEQYSTAYDTSLLLNAVSEYSLYNEYCKIWIDELVHDTGRKTELVNTNRLIKYYPYCLSGKTGFTDEAGYCLATNNQKDGLKVTCVVLGCNNSAGRFTDSINLLNDTFANYKNKQIISSNDFVENIVVVKNGKSNSIKLSPAEDYFITLGTVEADNVELVYDIPSVIHAPVYNGDIVGKILIVQNGEVIDEVDVISVEGVEQNNYSDIVRKVIDKFPFFE